MLVMIYYIVLYIITNISEQYAVSVIYLTSTATIQDITTVQLRPYDRVTHNGDPSGMQVLENVTHNTGFRACNKT